MVLYNSPQTASDTMTNATPEQIKASMDEWIKWRDEASKIAKVDFGLPLQVVSNITSGSVSDGNTKVSGYSIVEADSKDTVVELLKSHPQLKTEGTSIDVLEMLPLPEV